MQAEYPDNLFDDVEPFDEKKAKDHLDKGAEKIHVFKEGSPEHLLAKAREKISNKPKVRIERVLLDRVLNDNCVILSIGKESFKCVRVLNVHPDKCSITGVSLFEKEAFVPIKGATKRNLIIDASVIEKVMAED